MQRREHRPTIGLATPTGLIHQLPRRVPRRVLKGRAAGLLADWLGLLPSCGNLVHTRCDGCRLVGRSGVERACEDQPALSGLGRLAIGKPHLRIGKGHPLAGPRDSIGFDQNVLGLSPVATGIHHHRPADRSRHPAIKFQPRDPGLPRLPRQVGVKRRRPGKDGVVIATLNKTECATRQSDHNAFNAAISNQSV